MSDLYQKRGYYYGTFYDPLKVPSRKRVALRTKDATVARRKYTDLERAYAAGSYDPWTQVLPDEAISFGEAASRYLDDRRNAGLSDGSVSSSRQVLRAFSRRLPRTCPLRVITRRHIDGFFAEVRGRGCAVSSFRTYHARLNAFFRWCLQQRYLRASPMDGVVKPKAGKKVPRYFTPSQFDLLLGTIERDAAGRAHGIVDGARVPRSSIRKGEIVWLQEVIVVAVETGMRRSELCNMKWSWVNFDTNVITIRSDADYRPKSHHERTIPLGRGVRAVLERLRDRGGEPANYVFGRGPQGGASKLNGGYLSKRFTLYVRKAGLAEELTFHSLRHTFASWLVLAGVDLYLVKELLGHASIQMTQVYAHLAPQTLHAAIVSAFGGAQGHAGDSIYKLQDDTIKVSVAQ